MENVELPEDEAASIALHIVNAQLNSRDMNDTLDITKMIQNIFNIVKFHFNIELELKDENKADDEDIKKIKGVMVYPDFIGLVDTGEKISVFGLPVASVSYASTMIFVYDKAGWLAIAIMGELMPLLVMTGMHWAFVPLSIMNVNNPNIGFDTLLLVGMLCSNLAQASSCLAVFLKSKNNDLKQVAAASSI